MSEGLPPDEILYKGYPRDMWMELQMANDNDIPVIALARTGEDISSMVVGNPAVVEILRYEDIGDLLDMASEKAQELSN